MDQANDQDNRDVQEGMLSFIFFTLLYRGFTYHPTLHHRMCCEPNSRQNKIPISCISRKVTVDDYRRFDYIIAMDTAK